MSVIPPSTPRPSERVPGVPAEPIWRLSVAQYHKMIEVGVLTEDDKVELLEGWLVARMVKNPPHVTAVGLVQLALARALPSDWYAGMERPVTLTGQDSEPEPDVVVLRGSLRQYATHHPGPADVALIVEVADTSLGQDRGSKLRIYASAGLPAYWIVNVLESYVEVFSLPGGAAYAQRDAYRPGDRIPLWIDGQQVAHIPVEDLLP